MENQHPYNDSFENNNSIPKQNNFKIPEGYFDELASRLEEQLEIKNDPASNREPKKGMLRVLVFNVSIAAAVVVGVFLFNPDKGVSLSDYLAELEVEFEDPDVIYAEDYMISMVAYAEEQEPLQYFQIEQTNITQEEVAAVEMPVVNEITSGDLTDFFDEDYYYDDYEL